MLKFLRCVVGWFRVQSLHDSGPSHAYILKLLYLVYILVDLMVIFPSHYVQGCAKVMTLFSMSVFSQIFVWENLYYHHIFSAGVELDT